MSHTAPSPGIRTPMTRFARRLAGAVPRYANGGIAAGTLASHLDVRGGDAIEVRLQRPIPLAQALSVERGGTTATLLQDAEVLATARCVADDLAHRGPVDADAARASRPVVPLDGHPAPGCFVCGPANRRGLNLQPGAVDGHDLVATTWSPPAELADVDGQLPVAIVWAALDCPSWYGGAHGAPALLGTITARRYLPVPVTSPVVVSGWGERRDGRKTLAGSAIHSLDGELLAVASTIWIHPRSTTDG